ncbi:Spy/CpxP family protein refolding chaperone [Ramlibacter sp.]|uniref:Spy/CpxP family protein refolding chaperone n=1 Tax=Ramlibacter sp. TaxID=1917967 RepID=UPI002FCBB75E
MKKFAMPVLAALAVWSLAACSPMNSAQAGPGYGRGYGPGMMGQGPYGPGYGMMGPGFGGPGGGMMGGMMGGWGGWGGLPADLNPEQQAQIAGIQRELRARQWPLMQQMHELMWAGGERSFDESAERRDYDRLAALHKQMFDNMLEARKRIDAVLTPQQREQLRRGPRR